MGLLDKAKNLVRQNKDKIDKGVDKASEAIKKKTDDKMDARVDKAGDSVQDAVRKMD